MKIGRKHLFGLSLILLVYLALQITPILSVNTAQYDESIFLDIAGNIRRTGLPLRSLGPEGRFELDQTPGYLYLLSLLTVVFGDNLRLLRLVTVAAGLGCLVLTFIIACRARGPVAGYIAGILLALNPFFNLYSFFLRMEVFTCFFLLLAVYFLSRWEERPSSRVAGAAGVSIMIAVLLKLTAVAFWPAAVIWAAWLTFARRTRLRDLVWLALPTLIGLGLWLLSTLLDPNLQAITTRWRSALGIGVGVVDVRQQVTAAAWLEVIGRSILHWETIALLAAALVVYVLTWRRQPALSHLLVLYIGVAVGLSLAVQLKEARHLIGVIPAAALFIGLSIDWGAIRRWVGRRPARVAVFGVSALVVLWSLSPLRLPDGSSWRSFEAWWEEGVRDRYFYNDRRLQAVRDAGLYLAQTTPEDAFIIVARQGPVVAYYAGRNYTFLYTQTYADSMKLLQENEHLVMDAAEFWAQTSEESARLLSYIEQNFTAEQVFDNGFGRATVLRRNQPLSADGQ